MAFCYYIILKQQNNSKMLECDYTTEFWSRKRQKYGKEIIAERANFFFLKDGTVNLSLRKGKKLEGHLSVPFGELREKLQDTEGILKSLATVKRDPIHRFPKVFLSV